MGKCKRGRRQTRRQNRSTTQSGNGQPHGTSLTSVNIRRHWKHIQKLLDNRWLRFVIKALVFTITHANVIAHFLHTHGL